MKKDLVIRMLVYGIFVIVVIIGLAGDWDTGKSVLGHFGSFSYELIRMLPFVFILVGLFDVWVPREMIEKHLGDASKGIAYVWALFLAMTTVGGLFVALPIAQSLENKGASKTVVLTYLTGATVVRLPMTIFEMTFLGVKFTAIRWAVAIALTIASSFLMSGLTGEKKLFEGEQ